MIASSHEPIKKLTIGTEGSISTSPSSRSRKASLYSIIAGRCDSVFSNPSQQTITAPTSLPSSATFLSDSPGHNPSEPQLRVPLLRRAMSFASIKGLLSPSAVAGPLPSDSAAGLRRRKTIFWKRSRESDEAELQNNSLPPSHHTDNVGSLDDTPKSPVHVLERSGRGSCARRTNKHLHQSHQDHSLPNTSADTSDNVSILSAKTAVLPTIVRVVGRGGLSLKRRILSDPPSSSTPHISVVDSPQRTTHCGSPIEVSLSPLVSSFGGSGCRLRTQTSSPSSPTPKIFRFKFRWRSRKRAFSETGTKPTSPNANSSRTFSALRRARATTFPSLSNSNIARPPSTISTPPVTSTDIDFDSNSTQTMSISHSSGSQLPVPASKIIRTLGETIPSNALLSPSSNNIDSESHSRRLRRLSRDSTTITSNADRRASVTHSLSSIGSFMHLAIPSPEVCVYAEGAGDDEYGFEEGECWVDNEFDSHSPNGLLISPIIFSAHPPSPTPPLLKPKLLIDSTDSFVGSLSPQTEESGSSSDEARDEEDDALSDVFTPATSPNDGNIPFTPHSVTDTMCNAVSPMSPIVFSERPVSSLPPFMPGSDTEAGGDMMRPMALFDTSISVIRSLSRSSELPLRRDSPYSSTGADPPGSLRRRTLSLSPVSRGWTGEWNRKDVQDVIRSLRELK